MSLIELRSWLEIDGGDWEQFNKGLFTKSEKDTILERGDEHPEVRGGESSSSVVAPRRSWGRW